MAVGRQGSANVTVTMDDSGGPPRVITNFVMELGGVKISPALENSHAFGDAWEESAAAGVSKADDIAVGGLFDTTATTGPHVVFTPAANDSDPNGTSRTLAIVFGDSKTFTVETRIVSYEVVASVGKLSRFTATLRPTGTATWS